MKKNPDVGGRGYKSIVIRAGIAVSFNLSHHLSKSDDYSGNSKYYGGGEGEAGGRQEQELQK